MKNVTLIIFHKVV